MGDERFDRLTKNLASKSGVSRRMTLKALFAGGVGTIGLGIFSDQAEARRRRRRNPCRGKNWCVERTQTCGPTGGYGKCLIKVFGGNVCAEILFQVQDYHDCEEPNCTGCVAVLAAGGGDRCNNGASGYDYICARKV